MKNKSLTAQEIQNAVEKIRKGYDDYIIRYIKPPRLRQGFENRYWEALQSRIDISAFLKAEIEVLQELMAKEEERKSVEEAKKIQKENIVPERKNFADRIIEELKGRIIEYPDAPLPPEASFEIKKLFGMLMQFEQEHWPKGNKILRLLSPSIYSEPRRSLEEKVFLLGSSGRLPYPLRAQRYTSVLSRFPRDYTALEREEKSCIVEAAYLLHDLEREFSDASKSESLNEADKAVLASVLSYINSVLDDFRLRDLKPKQGVM